MKFPSNATVVHYFLGLIKDQHAESADDVPKFYSCFKWDNKLILCESKKLNCCGFGYPEVQCACGDEYVSMYEY